MSDESDGTDLLKSPQFWTIAATAVFLQHLLLLRPEGPFNFVREDLCFLVDGVLTTELCAALDAKDVQLVQTLDEASQTTLLDLCWRSGQVLSVQDVRRVLQEVCSPLETLHINWLSSLRKVILDISLVLEELMSEYLDVSTLRNIQVQHAAMFNEDWSTAYEVCWQASGAENSIIMPDVPNFAKQHFEHFQRSNGHRSTGETLLYQALALYLIPCHEILHIVQHLHGHLLDSDSHSYAMEHDASRLNYLLLWQVLERRSPEPSWSKWVLMLEGINRSMVSFQRLQGIGMAPLMAYRRWADSFGLDAPSEVFSSFGDEVALALEGMVKMIVAGEAFLTHHTSPGADLRFLLRVAFDPERRGDVYSL